VAEIGQAVHVGLMDLQQRIGELQRSVQTLATEGTWFEPGAHPPAAAYAHEPPPPPVSSPASPPQPELAYLPAGPAPPTPLAPAEWEQPFEPPPMPPPSWDALPPVEPAPPIPAPAPRPVPAADEGPPAGVTLLDAGPFADLIELRHFEEELAAVPGVHEVRVRRFGHGRARIEVGAGARHELMAEIGRAHGPTEISERPNGEIVIELPATERGDDADDDAEKPADSAEGAG
jgi:hypothetical protein